MSTLPNLALQLEVQPGVFEPIAEPGTWFPPNSIYALHAGDFNYRYVGQAANPSKRLYAHRYDAKRYSYKPVGVWINQVGAENVVMDILECPGPDALLDRERYWTWSLLYRGYDLLNQDSNIKAWQKRFRA